MKWTDAQQAVIDSKGQSLLVTAAAGSGKTAVLVERIIQKLTDSEDPWDIDQLLVVTFTRAAAKEMKDRIYRVLGQRLSEDRGDQRLRRMRERVFSADIRTIDSFCKTVVSEYFSQIDLDPSFRFMDQGEGDLLKNEVLEQLLRDEYGRGEEDFLALADIFSSKGSDSALSDTIKQVYEKAQASPWTGRFYARLRESAMELDEQSVKDAYWMKELTDHVRSFAADAQQRAEALLREASAENDGGSWDKLIGNLSPDVGFFGKLREADTYEDMRSLADTFRFLPVGRQQMSKGTEDQKVIADGIKSRRDAYREYFNKNIYSRLLCKPLSEVVSEENAKLPFVRELIRLCEDFDEALLREKTDRKAFEFSDIEHFAVQILLEEDGTPTEAARNYRRRYREVMVDEYQDTNELNEMILSAVSRDRTNYFMVGDVKQSIYGFRNADPSIILMKSEEYQKSGDAPFRRIDLDKNFRSRSSVTSTVNDIFRAIMIPEIGGVDYDGDAELKFGADYYPEEEFPSADDTRAVILLRDDDELSEIADEHISLEAVWSAQQIKRLFDNGFRVYDGEGGMRPLRHSDIAIILESTKVNAAKVLDVFASYGIPSQNAANTGYFSADEVVSTLDFLRIIDNPRQDIPLAGVLTSMYVGLDGEDISRISTAHKGKRFYEAVMEEDRIRREIAPLEPAALAPEKRERFDGFLRELALLREKKTDTPVYELIAQLYSDFGYDLIVSTLPGGERRRQNLLKLYDKALSFARTSFSGISAFISYIEKLEKYSADEGEADADELSEAVQVMTIHKSKGLEFPVVFLLGLGNSFHRDDDRVKLLGDRDISMPYIDLDRHTKTDTLHYQMLCSIRSDQKLGEELRVLYVALTRAKEKLYLVGSLKEKEREDLIRAACHLRDGRMNVTELRGATCFFKAMIPVLVGRGYMVETPAAGDFAENEFLIEKKRADLKEELLSESREHIKRRAYELAEVFTHPYAHSKEEIPKQKYSVSEIKSLALDEQIREGAADLYKPSISQKGPLIPDFMQKEKKSKEVLAVERGTAMHRFLEKLDLSVELSGASVDELIEQEIEKGFLTEGARELIDKKKLSAFLSSELARRMQQAFLRGDLYREQAFVTGDSLDFFFGGLDGEGSELPFADQVIVQGIIDAFFVENGKIVLIDYKTDFARTADELTAKYTRQLQLYQLALERGMSLPVKEMYIYSFALGSTVPLPLIGKEKP